MEKCKEEELRRISLKPSLIEKIELHDTERYDILQDPEFYNYYKLHSKGDPVHRINSWNPFRWLIKDGTYETDIWAKRYSVYDGGQLKFTTDEIISKVIQKLANVYGEENIVKTDEYGVVLINPHLDVRGDMGGGRETVTFTFSDYTSALSVFITITEDLKLYVPDTYIGYKVGKKIKEDL